MDLSNLDALCESFYIKLDLDNQSFEDIVLCYDSTLRSLFADNIYNRGRYFVSVYFAEYIAKRITHVEKYRLLCALRERLEKWRKNMLSIVVVT
jgi:hypothetical protein